MELAAHWQNDLQIFKDIISVRMKMCSWIEGKVFVQLRRINSVVGKRGCERWCPGWHGKHGKMMDSWRELGGLKKCVQLEDKYRSAILCAKVCIVLVMCRAFLFPENNSIASSSFYDL